MAEPIKKAFTQQGFLVREYAPVGELIPAMGYLVRRLLENTSNEGFLKASMVDGESIDRLMEKPSFSSAEESSPFAPAVKLSFENEALSDFSLAEIRSNFAEAIEKLRSELKEKAIQIKPRIAQKQITTTESIPSTCPEDRSFHLANVGLANCEQADEACTVLTKFAATWAATSVEERARVVLNAADIMEQRRYELSAYITLEAGKTSLEADADVAEAIDFCRYYAEQAVRLMSSARYENTAGEENQYFYQPRGVCLVISPWNFPLAIPCGMTVAALVTGNTVIHKPAEQTSLIAAKMDEILLEAGVPAEALCFLPGRGEEVAAHLSTKKEIATICFTGSKQVGLSLIENGSKANSFGTHVRKVLAEMGGKNAIIVDEDADLDEAVRGTIHSVAAFSGQKCSACSRVIVVGDIYQRFCERLKHALKSIHLGPPSDSKTLVGPVIDEEAQKRIQRQVEEFRGRLTVLAEQTARESELSSGYYVPAVAFYDVELNDPIQGTELFAPVMAISTAKDIESAIEAAMDSEYALTAGIYSRNPRTIALAREKLAVGNLYINRNCTGAIVSRQPFGGAHMSGVGAKAGGPDYLLQFVTPRSVTENTMRRGFAPSE